MCVGGGEIVDPPPPNLGPCQYLSEHVGVKQVHEAHACSVTCASRKGHRRKDSDATITSELRNKLPVTNAQTCSVSRNANRRVTWSHSAYGTSSVARCDGQKLTD